MANYKRMIPTDEFCTTCVFNVS